METKRVGCLRMTVPEWYLREDFKKWLEDWTKTDLSRRSLATWHNHLWTDLTTISDVFILYDFGDLSDGDDLPFDILEDIRKACEDNDMEHGIVWLAPCADHNTESINKVTRVAERNG